MVLYKEENLDCPFCGKSDCFSQDIVRVSDPADECKSIVTVLLVCSKCHQKYGFGYRELFQYPLIPKDD